MAASPTVRQRRHRIVATIIAGLVPIVLAVPTAIPAPAAAAPVPQLQWTDCGGGFQCATARVPLDYDRPGGAQISLALIRLPAGEPAHKLGSVFLNPGGPGGSEVEFVRDAGPVLFSEQVRARFGLVGFDPRGVIGSTALRCYDTLDQAIADALAPFPFPVTRKESGPGSASTATWLEPAWLVAARSWITCRPPTPPGTWICCARPLATRA
jgi:hypothetical protein